MIKEKLNFYNQQHLLQFECDLTKEEKLKLYNQIERLDFSYLEELQKNKKYVDNIISPISILTNEEICKQQLTFAEIGLEMLKKQEVSVVILAGGMGTRLGSNFPKGMFDIGITKNVYIFELHFKNLLSVCEKCGKPIPVFIMTSENNNQQTINFFESKNYFGYDKNYVKFFVQEMAPCTDVNGRILLEEKGKVLTSPNGNGGWFTSLLKDKEAKQMLDSFNIKYINLVGVDNVLQKIADPVFIGAVTKDNYEIGAKVVKKASPNEKVGVICKKNQRPAVVEYMDLSEELSTATNENGEIVYNHGVILNYLFRLDLLYKTQNKKLPVHIVKKQVNCLDINGNKIEPKEPNAYKFEVFCLDILEYANSCLPFEVEREKEFAPVKNKVGKDSVEVAQKLLQKNNFEL